MSTAVWTAHRDPNSGDVYYANTQTLETTWIRPSEYRDPNEPFLPPEIELEDNWVQILDPGTQRYYFANRLTSEVTWTPPNTRPKKMGLPAPAPVQPAQPQQPQHQSQSHAQPQAQPQPHAQPLAQPIAGQPLAQPLAQQQPQTVAQPQPVAQPVEEIDPVEAQKERERLERQARAEAVQRKQEEARAAMAAQALGGQAARFTPAASTSGSGEATPADPSSAPSTPRQPFVGGADQLNALRNAMLGGLGGVRLKKAGESGTATPAQTPPTQLHTLQHTSPQSVATPSQAHGQLAPSRLPLSTESAHTDQPAQPTPAAATTAAAAQPAQEAGNHSPAQQPQPQPTTNGVGESTTPRDTPRETPRSMPAPPPRPVQDPNAIVHDFDRVLDKASGQYYYVHKQTLHVQWEIPESYKLEALQRAQQMGPLASPIRVPTARLSSAAPPSQIISQEGAAAAPVAQPVATPSPAPTPTATHPQPQSHSHPHPTPALPLAAAMSQVSLSQPDQSPRVPGKRGGPPPLPPPKNPPPASTVAAAAQAQAQAQPPATLAQDPVRQQPPPPSREPPLPSGSSVAPIGSIPQPVAPVAAGGIPLIALPGQTYAQPQAGYGQQVVHQGLPVRTATPEQPVQQHPHAQAHPHPHPHHSHERAPVGPPQTPPPAAAIAAAAGGPPGRGPVRPPPPIRGGVASPSLGPYSGAPPPAINPQAPSQLPAFSPPAQSPAHHLTPQQLAEQAYKQQAGAPAPFASPQQQYGVMSPAHAQPTPLTPFRPSGPYVPPGATGPITPSPGAPGQSLPPSARPVPQVQVQVGLTPDMAGPHSDRTPSTGSGGPGLTPHHGAPTPHHGSGSYAMAASAGEARSSSIGGGAPPSSAPAAPTLPKGVYIADNGMKVLPAPIRADIQKFQMDGFAQQHFREFRQKTGLVSSKRVPVGQMMKWQNSVIHQSLLNSAKKFSSAASNNFETILNFMNDKPSKKQPSMLAMTVVNTGVQKEPLRDEIYCQLCKQTNDNPDYKSNVLGWKLMAMIVSAFAPTRDFQQFVLKHFLDNYHGDGDVGKLAPWCYYRIQRTIHDGPDPNIPTLSVIDEQLRVGVRSYTVMFNGTLEYILQLEKAEGSNLDYPRILPVLCDAVIRCGGFKVKGIFRLAANKSEIHRCRDALSLGKYEVITSKTDDPHTPADLLKIWLRELCEPLIPMSLYESCLKVSDNRNDCVALLHQIPLVHFRTLEYLLHFLAELAKSQAVTAMNEENIAIVFCTDILRTDEKDPAILFRNSPKEKNFVRNLILAWGQGQILQRSS